MDPPKPVIEADNCVVCPQCGQRIKLGQSGIENFKKRHLASAACKEVQSRRDKDKAKKKNSLLLTFFGSKALVNPSTVKEPAKVQLDAAFLSTFRNDRGIRNLQENEASISSSSQAYIPLFIKRLASIATSLPETIPIGSSVDDLARLAKEPLEYNNLAIARDELWEALLNPLLKGVLGWANDKNMRTVLRRGEKGMDGVLRFVEYFVMKRGVGVGLFEGKLGPLIEVVESIIKESKPATQLTIDSLVIDLSAEDSPVLTAVPTQTSKYSCVGYFPQFPAGISPHVAYPFALHHTRALPWTYTVRDGIMILHACNCRTFVETEHIACIACNGLAKNAVLEGILTRVEGGIHPNSQFEYHGIGSLVAVLRQKNEQIESYRLRGLNQAKTLLRKAAALTDHRRLLAAIASGKVERVDRVIRAGLSQQRGILGMMEMYERAAKGVYKPRTLSEEDELKAVLAWRMGGNRLAHINHRLQGNPSVTYLRNWSNLPIIIPSHGWPTLSEVSRNVQAVFSNILEVLNTRAKAVHVVLMLDELASKKRLRWDSTSNKFLGLCCEHRHKVPLDFLKETDLEDVYKSLDKGEVHYAKEITVAALGVLCPDSRLYPARAILASGDCKIKSGEEHACVIQTILDGVNDAQDHLNLRVVSITSDGESRRGLALAQLTFKSVLAANSPIYPLLSPLVFMNLHIGPDDITCDKDWKHIFKHFWNLFLRPRGVNVHGFRATPDIIQDHFRSEGHSADHIHASFNPKDQQDVKTAFDMLKDLWTLPQIPENPRPGAQTACKALWRLGLLVYHLVFPFLCVDLSLSEQLEHLSAAAHLLLVLYEEIGKSFIPTELFTDVMLMIKNVYFCVAKAKVDDPKGTFYIILLGTDRLETLFGILRTMVGNDANLNMLQIVSRLTGTTEIANILARFPHWNRSPRRLKIPCLTCDSKEIPDSANHIKPGLWRGNVCVDQVSLHSAWKRGRCIIEDALPFAKMALESFEVKGSIDILSPYGVLIVNAPLRPNNLDKSMHETQPTTGEAQPVSELVEENRVEVEDAVTEALVAMTKDASDFSRTVSIDGKQINKSRALARFSKYRKVVGSTDCLRRVQDVERYISAYSNTQKDIARSDEYLDESLLLVSDPVASLLCCEEKVWLCIGEVNALKLDGGSVDFIPHSLLPDERTTVSYQVLGLRPATTDDDSTLKFDWRSCRLSSEQTFTVPGRLVQPMNLDLSTRSLDLVDASFYLADSRFLVTLAASNFEALTISDLKNIPTIAPKRDFPYRERSEKACFICEQDGQLIDFSKLNASECSHCSTDVVLDLSQGQRVLEHVGAHILHDPRISEAREPCRLCLRPWPQCQFFLKKRKGA